MYVYARYSIKVKNVLPLRIEVANH